jgi:hypothetical protein
VQKIVEPDRPQMTICRMLHNYEYRHTLITFNISYSCTVKMVTRTRLNIKFIVHVYCLSFNISGMPAHGLTDWPKHVAVTWYISAMCT